MRMTSDSPTGHDPPVEREDPQSNRVFTSPGKPERGGLKATDDRAVDAYLQARLNRERATGLSRYGASYRALQRGTIAPRTHYQTLAVETPRPEMRHGKLAPSWREFASDTAREINRDARDSVKFSRYDRSNTEKLPYRGIRPEITDKLFYLPKGTVSADTISQASIATRSPTTIGALTPTADDQADAARTLLALACDVMSGDSTLDTLAARIVALAPANDVLTDVYAGLNHSKRKRLTRLLSR